MSPPIDTQYHWQTGPASSFAWFDSKIVSMEDLFNHCKSGMLAANAGHNDNGPCVGYLWNAIVQVSKETGILDTLILAIILQESSGNCRVKTTWDADGQPTGGLMQCSGCQGADGWATMTQDKVTDMVRKGCAHLKDNLNSCGWNKYTALRLYNSGSVAPSGDLSDPKSVGTPNYVSDVANRLHGWSN